MSKYTDEELRLHAIIAAHPTPAQRRASEQALAADNAVKAADASQEPDPLDAEAVGIANRPAAEAAVEEAEAVKAAASAAEEAAASEAVEVQEYQWADFEEEAGDPYFD